ncbi:MAG: helix-turn-helix transcriptional regulator [Clostridia bacterium]|nr:helix-turn-helix transcriptional regulator [Clostridia bacterium]
MIIARNIAELRKYLGLTQSELAEKLNYSDKAISKWERAESFPDILVLSELTSMCGVPLDYLVTDHEGRPLKPDDPKKKRNHYIIAFMSVALTWLLSTLAVLIVKWAVPEFSYGWIILLGAMIASEVIVLVFNSVWGNRKMNYVIITVLMWSGLTAFYLIFPFAQPAVFFIGIPGQLIIILWSMLSFKMSKKE